MQKVILIGNIALVNEFMVHQQLPSFLQFNYPVFVNKGDIVFWYLPSEAFYKHYAFNADLMLIFYDQLVFQLNLPTIQNQYLIVKVHDDVSQKYALLKNLIIVTEVTNETLMLKSPKDHIFQTYHKSEVTGQRNRKKRCC
ncbi:hypothetical protein SS50377_22833 [Spironucleus salmonicida]|uniref:Uncharacterized protein n=1 Tax=Spironucleus salmonicida TaxID=348837 RepID=V6LW12_9EUKA|nr:hypothetical protein SS50377_22833 [Spironucleus salmonicida]|eukprot:EST47896.1 Hypothetical protein SS50377_11997 [Spironucleus salmonicida]